MIRITRNWGGGPAGEEVDGHDQCRTYEYMEQPQQILPPEEQSRPLTWGNTAIHVSSEGL